jgi:membrane-associated protease RseP (regulator of RpoE activity)
MMMRWMVWVMLFPLVGRAEEAIRFGWSDDSVAVSVTDQPANRVLEVISAATGIPVVLDPANTSRLNGLYRKRTLEYLLLDLAPGIVILYRYDARLDTHVIDRVYSSSMVGAEIKQAQLRNLVVSREHLEQGIIPPVNRPVRYSGIGAAIRPAQQGEGIYLQPLSPSSPAARAGIKLGDLVTAVDGRSIGSFTNLMDIAAAIRGPENSSVSLSIRMPDGTILLRLVRREVFSWNPEAP